MGNRCTFWVIWNLKIPRLVFLHLHVNLGKVKGKELKDKSQGPKDMSLVCICVFRHTYTHAQTCTLIHPHENIYKYTHE